jgi:hypothetical protein
MLDRNNFDKEMS